MDRKRGRSVMRGLTCFVFLISLHSTAYAAEQSVTVATAPEAATTSSDIPEFDPFLVAVQNPEGDFEAERIKTRRTYLKVHQAAALTSLGLLIGQVALGQVLLNRKRDSDLDGYDNLRDYHRYLGITTFTVYSVAAGAAILAPKIDREGVYDRITLHKSLAIVHFTGMMLMPWLGYYQVGQSEKIKTQEDADRVRTLNTIHQVTGYTTAAALAGAMIVLTIQ